MFIDNRKGESMTYAEIYNKAKEVIGEENIDDYRPAVIAGDPESFFEFETCLKDTIMIWLKNGDTIMYRAN